MIFIFKCFSKRLYSTDITDLTECFCGIRARKFIFIPQNNNKGFHSASITDCTQSYSRTLANITVFIFKSAYEWFD